MRAIAALLLLALSASAAPVPKEAKQDALGQLVGLWEVVTDREVKPGNEHRFRFNKDGSASIVSGASLYKYSFAIDAEATVPTFSWIYEGGSHYIAIYLLEGDSLAVVFTDVKKPTPKEVKPGIGDAYYKLKRVK